MSRPAVSVVIATWRRAALLCATLDAIGTQAMPPLEVIVVSDGEDAATRSLAASYRSTFELHWEFLPENRGPAQARRSGAERAQGDLLLFLDDDMLPNPHWVAQHCLAHLDAENAVVCGRIVERYERPAASPVEAQLRAERDRILADLAKPGVELDAATAYCGANCSVPRALYFRAGGHARELSCNDDMELGYRLYARGVRFVINNDALAVHRSTHDLRRTCVNRAAHLGRTDVQRLRTGERSPQTVTLGSMNARSWRAVAQRLAWEFPAEIRRTAECLARGADVTASAKLFHLWHELATAAEYWAEVRAFDLSLEDVRQLAGNTLPIFMFHGIGKAGDCGDARFITPAQQFRRMLQWITATGRTTISSERRRNGHSPESAVWLTFDDGLEDFYTTAYPALVERRLQATAFIVAGRLGETNTWDDSAHRPPCRLMTAAQIRELHAHGIEIGSHSLTHPSLPSLTDEEIRREVRESKSRLEDLTGAPVRCFAYPFGAHDARVRRLVAEAGYELALSTEAGLSYWEDPLRLRRVEINGCDSLFDFQCKLWFGRSPWQQIAERLRSSASGLLRRLASRLPAGGAERGEVGG